MKPLLTQREAERHIDVLDRSEPSAPESDWAPSAQALRAALDQVYTIQRVIGVTLGAAILGTYLVLNWRHFPLVLNFRGRGDGDVSILFLSIALLVAKFYADAILKRIYPVLEYDDRAEALLRYYRAPSSAAVDIRSSFRWTRP